MCGIIGQYNLDGRPIDPEAFDRRRDTLRHRGPDGARTQVLGVGRELALGHRRLSILDLSEAGAQPMSNEDGTVWLTFNGEIYNFRPLREELVRAGHRFGSHTDSEVLVHGYEEWGLEGLLARCKGMFAFGLWDANRRRLFLVRDRFGIKPLVYYRGERQFCFASELKALMADRSIPRRMRSGALADYFLYSYVPSPSTVWENVHRLPPAHYLTFDPDNGRSELRRYWELRTDDRQLDPVTVADEFTARFDRAVTEHLTSDVPVGVFLSGGYDSASVLLSAQAAGGSRLSSFSLGFRGSERSEHAAAATIAERLGADHHERLLDFDTDVFPLLQRLATHYDEPFAVSSQLTYHSVSELAAETHKVVLAGDGGDELLAGYTWYRELPARRRGWRQYASALLGRTSLREQTARAYARRMTGVYFYLRKHPHLLPPALRRTMEDRAFDHFAHHLGRTDSAVKNLQELDRHTFLLDNCLQRADLSSMLHSLEVRVPFLDHELFEFVYGLDTGCYFDPQKTKPLLRRLLADHLPPEILDRKKQGFGFQHRETLCQPRYAGFLNDGELRARGILTGPVDLTTVNGEIAYHLLFLEQWFRHHQPLAA